MSQIPTAALWSRVHIPPRSGAGFAATAEGKQACARQLLTDQPA